MRTGVSLRLGHPGLQHHHLHGPADAERAAVLRPVRARGHRRAHPRQDRRLQEEGHVDGRLRAARLRGRRAHADHQRGRGRDDPGRSIDCTWSSARSMPSGPSSTGKGCAPSSEAGTNHRLQVACRLRAAISIASWPILFMPAGSGIRARSMTASMRRSSHGPSGRRCKRSWPQTSRASGCGRVKNPSLLAGLLVDEAGEPSSHPRGQGGLALSLLCQCGILEANRAGRRGGNVRAGAWRRGRSKVR